MIIFAIVVFGIIVIAASLESYFTRGSSTTNNYVQPLENNQETLFCHLEDNQESFFSPPEIKERNIYPILVNFIGDVLKHNDLFYIVTTRNALSPLDWLNKPRLRGYKKVSVYVLKSLYDEDLCYAVTYTEDSEKIFFQKDNYSLFNEEHFIEVLSNPNRVSEEDVEKAFNHFQLNYIIEENKKIPDFVSNVFKTHTEYNKKAIKQNAETISHLATFDQFLEFCNFAKIHIKYDHFLLKNYFEKSNNNCIEN